MCFGIILLTTFVILFFCFENFMYSRQSCSISLAGSVDLAIRRGVLSGYDTNS